MSRTHWTLAETLHRHGQKVSALARASRLSKNTVYDIVNGKTRAVTLETLDSLLLGLEQLTGEPMTIEDVLKRGTASDLEPDLQAQLVNAEPFDWNEVRQLIPHWTPQQKAENDAFWLEQERDRRSRGDKRMLRLEALWEELDAPQQPQ